MEHEMRCSPRIWCWSKLFNEIHFDACDCSGKKENDHHCNIHLMPWFGMLSKKNWKMFPKGESSHSQPIVPTVWPNWDNLNIPVKSEWNSQRRKEYKYHIVFFLLWEHPLGWHWCWWRKRSFRKPWDLPWTAFLPSTDSPPQASAKQHHNPESYILKANSHSSLVWVEPFFLFRYKLPNFWW